MNSQEERHVPVDSEGSWWGARGGAHAEGEGMFWFSLLKKKNPKKRQDQGVADVA